MAWRQKVWSQYTVIAWIPILQDQIQLPLFTPLGKIRVSWFLVSVTRIFFMWYKWGKNEFLVSRMCPLTTATSTVQVLPKILYFSTLISSWIWYSENYWLAHNFSHIRPSRSLSWLLSLWPTKLRFSLSNKKNNIMKKVDRLVRYHRETARFIGSVPHQTLNNQEELLQTYYRPNSLRGHIEIDTLNKAFLSHPSLKDQYHCVLVRFIGSFPHQTFNRQ